MTPSEAYRDQVWHSTERGIPWNMSYAEWLEIWLVSGKWLERGKKSGQYCMCRYGDQGPYSTRNCYIGTVEQNQRDRWELSEKINNDKARKIIETYVNTNLSQRDVGEIFGVDQSYVSRIINKLRKKDA